MNKPKSKVTITHVFKTIIWPRKNIILVGLLLIVISRLAGLVLPGATKFLMDDVIAKGDMHMLKLILWAVAGSILVQSVTSYMLTKILSVEAQHLISVLRARVQQQIRRPCIQNHERCGGREEPGGYRTGTIGGRRPYFGNLFGTPDSDQPVDD